MRFILILVLLLVCVSYAVSFSCIPTCCQNGWSGSCNFGPTGSQRWCDCCRNNCGQHQGACRNQGFGTSLCVAAAPPPPPPPPPSQSSWPHSWCSCVNWAWRKHQQVRTCGARHDIVDAKDYVNCGWHEQREPRIGGIVVHLPCYYDRRGWGNGQWGHISVFQGYGPNGSLRLLGANHYECPGVNLPANVVGCVSQRLTDETNCNNLSVTIWPRDDVCTKYY